MNVQDALDQLEDIKNRLNGEVELKIYIQTGADSYDWKDVRGFYVAYQAPFGTIIDTDYGD